METVTSSIQVAGSTVSENTQYTAFHYRSMEAEKGQNKHGL